MPDQNDWFSPGLGSVAAQQPMWPMQQGWQQPQAPAQPQPDWLNNIGSSISNLAGSADPSLAAVALAKYGNPEAGGIQNYLMMGENGQSVGNIKSEFIEPDTVYIHSMNSPTGPTTLGMSNMRSLLPELMREYPNMRRIGMYRATGARWGPATRYGEALSEGRETLGQEPSGSYTYNVPPNVRANPPNRWSGIDFQKSGGRWWSGGLPEPHTMEIAQSPQGLWAVVHRNAPNQQITPISREFVRQPSSASPQDVVQHLSQKYPTGTVIARGGPNEPYEAIPTNVNEHTMMSGMRQLVDQLARSRHGFGGQESPLEPEE